MGIGDGWDLPPGQEPWSDFHWFQPSTRGIQVFVILSDSPLWYTGHFHGGRMAPCSGIGCEYCSMALGAQIRYVFAVAECSSKRVGLFEVSRTNGLLIRELAERAGNLRGVMIEVSKHSKSAQSRTDIEYVDRVADPWYLGLDVPDCALALFLTWHKAGYRMPQELVEHSKRKLELKKARIEDRAARERDRLGSW